MRLRRKLKQIVFSKGDGVKDFKKALKKFLLPLGSVLTGFLNGLFGAGGGMSAVPVLKATGIDTNKAHANSVAVIVPLSAFSAVLYLLNKTVTVQDALPYIPSGLIGSWLGAVLLRKIPAKWLKRVFGIFIIWAGVRLLLK